MLRPPAREPLLQGKTEQLPRLISRLVTQVIVKAMLRPRNDIAEEHILRCLDTTLGDIGGDLHALRRECLIRQGRQRPPGIELARAPEDIGRTDGPSACFGVRLVRLRVLGEQATLLCAGELSVAKGLLVLQGLVLGE